jgi:hypothetical protein
MTMETLFSIANLTVFPFWLSMMLAPRSRWTERLVRSPLIVLPPIAIYAALVLSALGVVVPAVARPQLTGVAALLGSPLGATAAWAHFLAFDLFVGRWIFLDARERNLPAPVVSLLLLATLMLGPLGLAAYFAVRAAWVRRLVTLFRRAEQGSKPLAWMALSSALLLAANLALMVLDPRQLTGAPLWLKPAKFAVSIVIAGFTLAFLMPHIRAPGRRAQRAAWIIAAMGGLELVVINLQAARGVTSHFNFSSLFNGVAFQTMGAGITVFTIAVGYLGIRTFRQQFADRALGWGIRFGFVAMLFGSVIAFAMPRPTPDQLATLKAHQPTPTIGAHAVGVPDGGPGLPVTHWSTEGGDLRVPHFIGIHGLQLLPLAGWALSRRRRRSGAPAVSPELGARLSAIAGAGYLGLVATTLVQALRARPLFSPDLVTVAFGAVVLVGCVVAAVAAVATSPEFHRENGSSEAVA